MRIFIPVGILVLLLVGYFFAWQHSARELRSEVEDWITEEREGGRVVEHEGITVRGFPYRMQIEIRSPHIADPVQGWSWQAENILGFVLPYRLNHAVVVLRGEQQIEFLRLGRREVITSTAEDLRASIVIDTRGLDRFSLEAGGIAATREIHFTEGEETLERTEQISIATLEAYSRRVPGGEGLPTAGRHDAMSIEAHDIVWEGHPYRGLGSDIPVLHARVMAAGLPESNVGSIARDFLRRWHENQGVLFLDEAIIRWSEIEVAGTGVFEMDNRNRLEGEMTIFVSGYDRAIDALVAGGALDPEYANISKTVLDVIAALGGDPEGRIRAPLRMEGGTVFLGPAELMDLPPMY